MSTDLDFNHNPYAAPKSDEVPPVVSGAQDGPKGLSGWLWVVAFGLIVTAISLPLQIYRTYSEFLLNGSWTVLSDPNSAYYHPVLKPLIVFEFLGNTALIGMTWFALFLFFTKSKRFPNWYVWFKIINIVFLTLDIVIISSIPVLQETMDRNAMRDLFAVIISAMIWIPYMKVSKRVRNTFVMP